MSLIIIYFVQTYIYYTFKPNDSDICTYIHVATKNQTWNDFVRNTVGTCINMNKAILVYSEFNKPCILDHHEPKLVLWSTVFSRVDPTHV
jgi:hypothetical protein